MTDFTKGVLKNTFAQRALLHYDGSIEHVAAQRGPDVNPDLQIVSASPGNNVVLNNIPGIA